MVYLTKWMLSVVSKGGMISEKCFGKGVEGSGCGLI
jgi:hypothetical protein